MTMNKQFASKVTEVLDQFEKTIGDDDGHSRVVYAIVIAQVFKRYISKFGFKSARIVLRNLFGMFYKLEQQHDQATAAQIQQSLRDKGHSPLPPKDPPETGDKPGRSPS